MSICLNKVSSCLSSRTSYYSRCAPSISKRVGKPRCRQHGTHDSRPFGSSVGNQLFVIAALLSLACEMLGSSSPHSAAGFLITPADILACSILFWLYHHWRRDTGASNAVKRQSSGAINEGAGITQCADNSGACDRPKSRSCCHARLVRRQRAQLRRVHLQRAMEQLRAVVVSLGSAAARRAGANRTLLDLDIDMCDYSTCSSHDFHKAPPLGFLLPVEVAANHYPEGISEHLQRLLEDRSIIMQSRGLGERLATIVE
eukprot:TRINITY_DN66485_c0_g1_i1.p1 TRINITY_DN66485_c0_g1~~TRINITY_DN66485_c0_g1_i1.p1  ORF type:complete len:258 (-),score=35.19 TRINITY_DN66485_c0_g1_i1:80-853(-)